MNPEELNELKKISRALEKISDSIEMIKDTLNQSPPSNTEHINKNINNTSNEISKINSIINNQNLDKPFKHDIISSSILINKLEEKNIIVKTYTDITEENKSLDFISVFMGEKYNEIKRVYETIKYYLNKPMGFHLDMKNSTQNEISYSCQLCKNLYDIAFLSEYKYDKSPKFYIHATPNKIPIAINFLTGHWLEIFIRKTVETCLESMQMDLEYTYIINPQISLPNGDDFELDVVFLINNELFWIEGKTGHYQQYINKYSKVSNIMGLDKNHSFLVLTDTINSNTRYILTKTFEMTVIPVIELKIELEYVLNEELSK